MTEPSSDETAGPGFDELTYDDCLARLATEQVGRLAVMVNHYPQVFCVNYRLDDYIVVFHTDLGTKLLAANHANVGFEVDHFDYANHSGWSVLIQGMAEDVTDRGRDPITERSRQLGVEPGPPGDKPRIVRVIPAKITGRLLPPRGLARSTDDRAYL